MTTANNVYDHPNLGQTIYLMMLLGCCGEGHAPEDSLLSVNDPKKTMEHRPWRISDGKLKVLFVASRSNVQYVVYSKYHIQCVYILTKK